MTSLLSFRALASAACFMFATSVVQAELMVGDKAPKLQTGKWVQGESVKRFDTNHVYIVEFWATWCGPCVGSIPHLNALWQEFKDKGVIVIGQDVWDSDAAVAPFVKKMGTNMTYRVALDDKSQDPDGFMNSHWWKQKENYHGIPTAFVINQDGIIAWIGHPMTLNEQVLNDILSGRYDLAKAAVDYKQEWEVDNKFQALEQKLFLAIDEKKWNDAESVLNEISNEFPELQNGFAGIRLKVLLGQKKYDEAYQFADSFSDTHPADFYRQNDFAWTIVTQEGVEQRNLKLAEKLAERADASCGGTNAEILDTLARAQFMSGKTNEAVATEQKAVEFAPDETKNWLKSSLTDYQRGKLPEVKQ